MMLTIISYVFVGLTAIASLGIIFSKNVFKSALMLLVALVSVAAIYVLSFAEFLAVTQIMVYAGGILVVIIFGVMLTTKISGRPLEVHNANIFPGALLGISIFVILFRYLPGEPPGANAAHSENITTLGILLFSDYSLPFEVAGLLLLVALIGAAVVTSHLKTKV